MRRTILTLATAFLLLTASTPAQSLLGDGGAGPTAVFSYPHGIALGPDGGLFIADEGHDLIRKISASGELSTVAGSTLQGFFGDGRRAIDAGMKWPTGVAVSSDGTIYFADNQNDRIRKVAADGIISTVAGGGSSPCPQVGQGLCGDGGPAIGATLNEPQSVAVAGNGDLFIADTLNGRIRRVTADGTITTFAGGGSSEFVDVHRHCPPIGCVYVPCPVICLSPVQVPDIDAREANIGLVRDVAVGPDGSVYFSAVSYVAKVTPEGKLVRVGGTGDWGSSGDGGPALAARFKYAEAIDTDLKGNIFIADVSANRVRKIDTSGIITTIAGNGSDSLSGDGGPAVEAGLPRPRGIAAADNGSIYISDSSNHRIRRVDAAGTITSIAGGGVISGPGTMRGVMPGLAYPEGGTVDPAGNIFLADTERHQIKRRAVNGTVSVVAGTGARGSSGDGGPALSATLTYPRGVAVAGDGSVFFSEPDLHRVRRVTPNGLIETFAGTGSAGFSGDNGPALLARLNRPSGLAIVPDGGLLIADSANQRVRKVSTSGRITTFAGTGSACCDHEDGLTATQSDIRDPQDVAVGSDGSVFIALADGRRIEKVDPSGSMFTAAGLCTDPNPIGGPARQACMGESYGVAVSSDGIVFISDTSRHFIRAIDASGTMRIVAGTGWGGSSNDGGLATRSAISYPRKVMVMPNGDLVIVDTGNGRLRSVEGPLPQ